MSKVPLPERGQPLDVSYIYQLANTINELSNQLSPVVGRYTSIDTVSGGQQNIRTSDVRMVGGYVTVTNNDATTLGGEVSFSYPYNDFAYVPVVTASPIIIETNTTDAGRDVSVILTRITTNRVEGVVRFNTISVASVGVNLLILGVPI
jgi:hypothetical protein